jgi:16S rRNA (adenine1518-N6/adenine1519-N6)-dimethyltransferase
VTDAPARPAMEDPRKILERYGLAAKKSWGQNFLRDRSVLARIAGAARASSDDVVVEIGAGLGALTVALAEREPPPARIIAIERDPDMLSVLAGELGGGPGIEVVAADAAHFDFVAASQKAGRPLIVVGNLPYQIASQLILGLIEAGRRGAVARAIVMVQREMAQRIVAPPGGRVYGRLTVAVTQHAEARILFHVRPGSFHPAPAVTSSVLSLVPRAAPLAPVRDAALFEEVVKQAFATRRKMLRRALAARFGEEKTAAALVRSGIAGTKRAEELAVADFARLANALAEPPLAEPTGLAEPPIKS